MSNLVYKLVIISSFVTINTMEGYTINYIEQDTIPPKQLEEIIVTPKMQYVTSQRTVYIPSAKIKKSCQTGVDLLGRLGIPQIEVDFLSQTVQAAGGDEVGVFINFVPCTAEELAMMPIPDVIRVDYYDHPSDSRFLGKPRVINIIMKKKDYGGYAKLNAEEGFLVNKGFIKGFVRNQHKRMTYDLMCVARQETDNHRGTASKEIYNLENQYFFRNTSCSQSKFKQRYGQFDFRVLYSKDNITTNNLLSGGLENTPHQDFSGKVQYEGISMPTTLHSSSSNSRNGFLDYKGNFYFKISNAISLTSRLNYTYSRTKERYFYDEGEITNISNMAYDTSHDFDALLFANINLKKGSQFSIRGRASYSKNRTEYAGSSTTFDSAGILYCQMGTTYNLTKDHFYGQVGAGWSLVKSSMNSQNTTTGEPYADVFFRYTPNIHNSVSLQFHYSEWSPSSNLKSAVVLQNSPYIWHTGNPLLKAYKSYDLGLFYTFMPTDAWNFTVFSDLWATKDRYTYTYQSMSEQLGIIRTLQQPMGAYIRGRVGLNCSVRLFDGSLTINGNATQTFVQNKAPYNSNLNRLTFRLGANWYLGNFDLGLMYKSSNRFSESDIYNTEITTKDIYILSVGWSNSAWNIRLKLNNLFRWNWENQAKTSNYEHYAVQSIEYANTLHANIAISCTYTLNFGKKVNKGNESQEQNLNSSGILH